MLHHDAEATVRAAGFEILAEGYRAVRNVRLLEARASKQQPSAAEQLHELIDRQPGVANQPAE